MDSKTLDSKTLEGKTLEGKTLEGKMLDSKQAMAALGEIEAVTRQVRQSRFYRVSSTLAILWGGLVAAGDLTEFAAPAWRGLAWLVVYAVGIAATVTVATWDDRASAARGVDVRMLAAYFLFVGFGVLWTEGLVQMSPRLLNVFWPTYFMLAYAIGGLWFGIAFTVIGLVIAALTLVGYFFAGPWFGPWMAVVNGGGLVLAGLWMRRN